MTASEDRDRRQSTDKRGYTVDGVRELWSEINNGYVWRLGGSSKDGKTLKL